MLSDCHSVTKFLQKRWTPAVFQIWCVTHWPSAYLNQPACRLRSSIYGWYKEAMDLDSLLNVADVTMFMPFETWFAVNIESAFILFSKFQDIDGAVGSPQLAVYKNYTVNLKMQKVYHSKALQDTLQYNTMQHNTIQHYTILQRTIQFIR